MVEEDIMQVITTAAEAAVVLVDIVHLSQEKLLVAEVVQRVLCQFLLDHILLLLVLVVLVLVLMEELLMVYKEAIAHSTQ